MVSARSELAVLEAPAPIWQHPAWLVLFLVAAFVVRKKLPATEPDRWDARVDLPLAGAVGLVSALLGTLWLADFHMVGWPLTASDFDQYCMDVMRARDGGGPVERSQYGRVLPGALAARFGVLGSLTMVAGASLGVISASIALWARSVAGRAAGVTAGLLTLAVAQLPVLSRTVTFYPESLALTTAAAALTGCALCWRRWGWVAAASTALGLALLVDVRAITTALVCVPLLVMASVSTDWRRVLVRGVALAVPLAGSWWLQWWTLPADPSGLGAKLYFYAQDAARFQGTELARPPSIPDWNWGWQGPVALVETLQFGRRLLGSLPPVDLLGPGEAGFVVHRYVLPWAGLTIVSLLVVLGLLAARKKPWHAAAVLLPLVPALAATWSALNALPMQRFVTPAAIVPALFIGCALGVVLGTRQRWAVVGAAALLTLLLTTGVLPSFLSPTAQWRAPVPANSSPRDYQLGLAWDRCGGAIVDDREAGRWQLRGDEP